MKRSLFRIYLNPYKKQTLLGALCASKMPCFNVTPLCSFFTPLDCIMSTKLAVTSQDYALQDTINAQLAHALSGALFPLPKQYFVQMKAFEVAIKFMSSAVTL